MHSEGAVLRSTFVCTLLPFRAFLPRREEEDHRFVEALASWHREGGAAGLEVVKLCLAHCTDVRLQRVLADLGQELFAVLADCSSASATQRQLGVGCVFLGLFRLALLVPSSAVDPLLVPVTKLQALNERLAALGVELEVCCVVHWLRVL